MKIEHIAMYVNDLEKTREFFIKYLGQYPTMDITIPIRIFVPIFFPLRMEPGWRL